MENIIWRIKSFEELTHKEVYELLKLRQEVFIVEQTCYYLDADGSDHKALHLWAEQNETIIACCRIFDKGIKYKEASIGRVCTKASVRKTGIGRILMNFAITTIETRFKTKDIRISAQDYLLNFYKSLGFIDTEKKYLEDDIPHTEMVKQ